MSRFPRQVDPLVRRHREPDHPVDSVFINRWSPRAFAGEAMPIGDLLTILEAARWAPSAYNLQPWRFTYSTRGDAHWDSYLELLDPFNAGWARSASALVFVISDTVMPAQATSPQAPSRTHSFDAGAAWAHLALQATMLGYQAHAMAGIHYEAARRSLRVPNDYQVEIAVAIGTRAAPSCLPTALQERETPSTRLSLDEIAFAGRFSQGRTNVDRNQTSSVVGGRQ